VQPRGSPNPRLASWTDFNARRLRSSISNLRLAYGSPARRIGVRSGGSYYQSNRRYQNPFRNIVWRAKELGRLRSIRGGLREPRSPVTSFASPHWTIELSHLFDVYKHGKTASAGSSVRGMSEPMNRPDFANSSLTTILALYISSSFPTNVTQ